MQKDLSIKKVWIEPAIILISSANIETKSHPTIKESTGHVNSINPLYFNSKYNGNAFNGTKYQAHS